MGRTLAPFAVPLRRSRLWLGAVLLVSLALCAALLLYAPGYMLLPLPWLVWRALAADGWLPGVNRVDAIKVTASGRMLALVDGEAHAVVPLDESVALSCLIVLNLRWNGRHRALALFPDSAPAEARRQLRVFLRWSGSIPPDSQVS